MTTLDMRAGATRLQISKYRLTWDELETSAQEAPDLIPGLATSDLTALIGRPFVGKTTLAYHLAMGVVFNQPVLGRQPREPDSEPSVVVVTTDPGTHRKVLPRMRRIGLTRAEHEDRLRVYYRYRIGQLGSGPLLEDLSSFSPSFVIVDNFLGSVPLGSNVNETAGVDRTMDALVDLSDQYPTLFIHHAPKGGSEGWAAKGEATTPLGSTDISAKPRRVINLEGKQSESYRTLTITNNDDPFEQLGIEMTPESLSLTDLRLTKSKAKNQKRKPTDDEWHEAARLVRERGCVTQKDIGELLQREMPHLSPGSKSAEGYGKAAQRNMLGGRGVGSRILSPSDGELGLGPGLDWRRP